MVLCMLTFQLPLHWTSQLYSCTSPSLLLQITHASTLASREPRHWVEISYCEVLYVPQHSCSYLRAIHLMGVTSIWVTWGKRFHWCEMRCCNIHRSNFCSSDIAVRSESIVGRVNWHVGLVQKFVRICIAIIFGEISQNSWQYMQCMCLWMCMCVCVSEWMNEVVNVNSEVGNMSMWYHTQDPLKSFFASACLCMCSRVFAHWCAYVHAFASLCVCLSVSARWVCGPSPMFLRSACVPNVPDFRKYFMNILLVL